MIACQFIRRDFFHFFVFEEIAVPVIYIFYEFVISLKIFSCKCFPSGRLDHWVQDPARNTCTQCQQKFTLAERKHHCRNCGHIFCAKLVAVHYLFLVNSAEFVSAKQVLLQIKFFYLTFKE